MLLALSNSLWQMGYKSLSLQLGGLKVFTQPQYAFKVTMNHRLQALSLLPPIKEELFVQKTALVGKATH